MPQVTVNTNDLKKIGWEIYPEDLNKQVVIEYGNGKPRMYDKNIPDGGYWRDYDIDNDQLINDLKKLNQ